jgi:FdhD protein
LGLGNSIKIEKIRSGDRREEKRDIIPREILLHIFLNDRKISVISCSPEDLIELAAGYAVSNGYVGDYRSINIIELCQEEQEESAGDSSVEDVTARIRADIPQDHKTRPGYISPGCGSIDEKGSLSLPDPVITELEVGADVILGLNKKNLSGQRHKKAFGGLHSASLFDSKGEMLLVREDIGRHNCLDKIMGHMLINEIDVSDKLVFTSGRISLDLVFKAVRMSIPGVVTNSSVTHGAVVMARRLGLMVIGYARGNRFNAYSYQERII